MIGSSSARSQLHHTIANPVFIFTFSNPCSNHSGIRRSSTRPRPHQHPLLRAGAAVLDVQEDACGKPITFSLCEAFEQKRVEMPASLGLNRTFPNLIRTPGTSYMKESWVTLAHVHAICCKYVVNALLQLAILKVTKHQVKTIPWVSDS